MHFTILASVFSELSNDSNEEMVKLSFIRKLPKGYWGVFSHKNKLLGKYKSRRDAIKRLYQIEFWKNHNK